jgi:hypothetical protein
VIAGAGADELKHVGVAAFEAAVDDVDRLAPQDRRAAVAGLTGERVDAVGPDAQPRVTVIVRARCGDDGRSGSRPGHGYEVKVARPAHSTHRQGSSSCRRGLEQRCQLPDHSTQALRSPMSSRGE